MDFRQLEAFARVAETRSFSRAADALRLTQSTISEHVRLLEEEVGARLFDRLGRETLPTRAGELLYGYARQLLTLRAEAQQALQQYLGQIAGTLLAREVGLSVPDIAACYLSGETYAGSRKVEDAIREIDPWLARPQKVPNFGQLFETVVVDGWLANKDRNIGNVLARPIGGSRVEFVMIDFEKS